MARRPSAPRRGSGPAPRSRPQSRSPERPGAGGAEAGASERSTAGGVTRPRNGAAADSTSRRGTAGDPSTGGGRTVARRGVGAPAATPETDGRAVGSHDSEGGRSRVVQAADRFRTAVAGKPWQRHRRTLLVTAAIAVLAIAGLIAALLFVPALQVKHTEISGAGYVDTAQVQQAVGPVEGEPLLTVGTSGMQERIEKVPGVASAEVHRSWPDTVAVTITEREPLAVLTRQDGSTVILDAQGVELPETAGEGRELMPMEVGAASKDPQAATETMLEVLAALPADMHPMVESVTATSRSDVTLKIQVEDVGTKEVIWGDAADGELKAEVVQALLTQPGSVIDVTSPVAPVTR